MLLRHRLTRLVLWISHYCAPWHAVTLQTNVDKMQAQFSSGTEHFPSWKYPCACASDIPISSLLDRYALPQSQTSAQTERAFDLCSSATHVNALVHPHTSNAHVHSTHRGGMWRAPLANPTSATYIHVLAL